MVLEIHQLVTPATVGSDDGSPVAVRVTSVQVAKEHLQLDVIRLVRRIVLTLIQHPVTRQGR